MELFSFVLFLIWPQAVDHPYLVVYSSTALARRGSTNNAGYVEQPCGLCHDIVEDPVVSCILSPFLRNKIKSIKERTKERNKA